MRTDEFLRGFWYLAVPGKRLKAGKMLGKTLLGDPVLIGRRRGGGVFALRDICPHRAIPLSYGRLADDQVQCCYHGWKFDCGSGVCTEIPALTGDDNPKLDRIKVATYPCREVQGNIWVYMPEETGRAPQEAGLPPVPFVPGMGDRGARVTETQAFPCHADWAVITLMDPAHAGFVHTSWWWTTGKPKLREKAKPYGPVPMGFQLIRFPLHKSARPYKLLGRNVSTEITHTLPGVRVEHIVGDRYAAGGLTAITPIDENNSEVHHCLYWTVPGIGALRPIAKFFVWQFLSQDRGIAVKQMDGLAHDDKFIFRGDADQEARWYFQLKAEYLASRKAGRPFKNPVKARTLRWRS